MSCHCAHRPHPLLLAASGSKEPARGGCSKHLQPTRSASSAGEEGFYVLLMFFLHFIGFRQTHYLNIYQTDLHEICRIGRTLAVDERCYVYY